MANSRNRNLGFGCNRLQNLTQGLSKPLLGNRFSQDRVNVRVLFDYRGGLARSGHEDDRLPAAQLFYRGGELQTSHARHGLIRQEKIKVAFH